MEIDRAPRFLQIDIKNSKERLFPLAGAYPWSAGGYTQENYHALRKYQARMGVEFSLAKVFNRHMPKTNLVERAKAIPHTNMCVTMIRTHQQNTNLYIYM